MSNNLESRSAKRPTRNWMIGTIVSAIFMAGFIGEASNASTAGNPLLPLVTDVATIATLVFAIGWALVARNVRKAAR